MNSKKYNLFLDDDPTRIPHKLAWIQLPLVEWTIVRNYKDFVKIITENGLPTMVSFDHDLGQTSYSEFLRAHNSNKIINYENIKEKSGKDCAKFIANYCIEKNVPIPVYYIHSLNYIGGENIRSILESAKKVIKNKSIIGF